MAKDLLEDAGRDWECLPECVLDFTVNSLVSLLDCLQFSAVCKRRYSFARYNHTVKQRCLINSSTPQLPLLLIPAQNNTEEKCGFYNVINHKTYDFQLHIPFNKRISASFHGWLLIVEQGLTLTLLNPFSSNTITLPRFDDNVVEANGEGYEYHVFMMALSKDPYLRPHDFELVIIYHGIGKLGLYRSRDKSWTHVTDHPEIGVLEDLIFSNNTFYVGDHWRGLGRIEWTRRGQPIIT